MKTTLTHPPRFTNNALIKLIWPLVLEQFLLVAVGMADTMMVSVCGEGAISGISLVDQINILLIQVFAALATGGAVVASQYLGRRERDNASRAAKQLLYLTLFVAVGIMALVLVFNLPILRAVFGAVEPDVMEAAETYFWLSALSYPFLGIYNAGAALFRSMGNSKISLFASVIMNVINITGNAILIFGFGLGVAGAAIASLIGRAVAAVLMVVLLCNEHNPICLKRLWHPEFSREILRGIFRVSVPSGVESSLFQVGKLLVASLVASFGTAAIAANAICNNIASMSNVPGQAVGLATITVIGQCVGAKDFEQTRYYTRKLMGVSYVGTGIINALIFLLAPTLVGIYNVSTQAAELAILVLSVNCVCSVIFWPMSFTMPNALRAAGDVRFTMTISMISMWVFRILMSYVLGLAMGLGFLGVWLAMVLDWVVRGICFYVRFRSGVWEKAKVIDA